MEATNEAPTPVVLRVVHGRPTAEELAVVTAVLLARAAAAADARTATVLSLISRSDQAGWRRLERAGGFEGPRSWQRAAA
ncbi:acyl-CoA carboxylase epsilon subunit [Streptacidiphilus jiangxiensis]|uniref:Acyl-CoA carboxylase epsilon subunit n=1 Tax=Streptacidiphilus jiangxiensis TaxID=235985 RepID=A0A1H7KJ46_STRJI|nr:acyl-CoA carboxylase epsilon subunit [Streptacidiphilus jiangxiensis]SEK86808.1 Acyl-CoA carboxylase epsilon subunit [Streptacidiphilus jiangxiensis]